MNFSKYFFPKKAFSLYFNEDWYISQYNITTNNGMPLHHYLTKGAALGFDPSPHFSTQGYLEAYPDVAASGTNPLVHFLEHGRWEGRLPIHQDLPLLDEALWSEKDPQPIYHRLKAIIQEGAPPPVASFAAWILARWLAWKERWAEVKIILAPWTDCNERLPFHKGPQLLEIEAHIKSGDLLEAHRLLKKRLEQFPDHPDFLLASCNLLLAEGVADVDRLKQLNHLYEQQGLSLLALRNSASSLTLDTLASSSPFFLPSSRSEPLVTVLVPAFNAERTLVTALESLAHQTWQQLEILIIDDASNDSTATLGMAFAEKDSRFRLLCSSWNQGPYAARNMGLAEAKGEYITVHDADDWSHPQKIELQMRLLLEQPNLVASMSHWVRCTDTLCFGCWRMEEGWIYRNISSLLFRRTVFEKLGYWDAVKAEADTEYSFRLFKVFGIDSVKVALPGIPLSFGRTRKDSLTRNKETHLVTQFRGGRCEYRKAAKAWHATARTPHDLFLPHHPTTRPFPIPQSFMAGVRELEGEQLWKENAPCLLLVGHAASRHLFGGERSLVDLAEAFTALGLNIIITLPQGENTAYNTRLRRLAHKLFLLPYAFWRKDRGESHDAVINFTRILHQFPVQIVYINTLVLWEPLLAARLCNIPIAVHVRELPETDPDLCADLEATPKAIREHILTHADWIIANSHCVSRWLQAPERTTVIPNGLNPAHYPLTAYDLETDTFFRICLISSNIPKKGLEDFVEMARLLEVQIPSAECWLVGPKTSFVDTLRRRQKYKDIPQIIHFGEYTDGPQKCIARSSVLVNLSRFQESFGRTVLEAMLMGRPVVCYAWGALPELVQDGETGFLVPFGDIGHIVERLYTLYKNRPLRQQMSTRARIVGLTHFNLNIFQLRLKHFLERIGVFSLNR